MNFALSIIEIYNVGCYSSFFEGRAMEPGQNLLCDYWNEPFGFLCGVGNSLYKCIDELSGLSDDEFLTGLMEARKKTKVRTVDERFFLPDCYTRYSEPKQSILVEWVERNPTRISRINHLADTLNTTVDVSEFKRSFNAIGGAIYGEDNFEPWFEVPASPSAITKSPVESPKV